MVSRSRSQTPMVMLILPIFANLLFSHCQQVRSVSPDRISSHPRVESSGGEMKSFNLTMGDEIDRIELNILSTEKEYRFEMDNSVRFCRKFHPASPDSNASCSAKLSFSLLKMRCEDDGQNSLKIQRVSTDKSGEEFHSKPDYLCKNFTYEYFEADVDKHYIGYFEAEDEIIVTPLGRWSENSTRASILVSVHYEIKNGDCPSLDYFDCNEKCKEDSSHCPDWQNRNGNWTGEGEMLETFDAPSLHKSVCVPSAWLCDKLPNCGIYDDADESQGLCFWGENGEEGTSMLKKFQNFSVLMLDVIFMGIIPLCIVALLVRAIMRKFFERPGPDPEANSNSNNSTAPSNAHIAGQNERAERPPFFTRQNIRRKSDEPPTYDEVILRLENQNQTTTQSANNGSNRDRPENSSTL